MIEIEKGYYVRLLITYTQIISLIYTLDFDFQMYVAMISQVGNPTNLIVYGLECSLKQLGVEPNQFLYVSTLMSVLSPYFQFVVICILMLIIKKVTKTRKTKRFLILSVVYLVLISQPGIVSQLASFLSCTELYPGSPLYVSVHPNWTCETDQYKNFVSFVVLPNLFIWAIAIPGVVFLVLVKNKHHLDGEKMRISMGSLYNDTKNKYYYWGVVVMLIKLLINFMAFTLQDDLKTRIFTLFFILWGYQTVVKILKPYRYAQFNQVESITYTVFMASIILAFYYVENPYPFARRASLVILIVINIIMMGYIVWKLLKIFILRAIYFFEKRIKKDNSPDGKYRLGSKESRLQLEDDRGSVLVPEFDKDVSKPLVYDSSVSNESISKINGSLL
jgi:hypothetical protein